LVGDIFDAHAKLRRHLLSEINGNAGVAAGFGLVGPERAAGGADADRDAQLSTWRDFASQIFGARRASHHHRDTQQRPNNRP
jgi:hypothetical protein